MENEQAEAAPRFRIPIRDGGFTVSSDKLVEAQRKVKRVLWLVVKASHSNLDLLEQAEFRSLAPDDAIRLRGDASNLAAFCYNLLDDASK